MSLEHTLQTKFPSMMITSGCPSFGGGLGNASGAGGAGGGGGAPFPKRAGGGEGGPHINGFFFLSHTKLEASLSLLPLLLSLLELLKVIVWRPLVDRLLGALMPTRSAVRLMRS